jgi:glutamate 5-kinase
LPVEKGSAIDFLNECAACWNALDEARRKLRRSLMYSYGDQWGDYVRDPDTQNYITEGELIKKNGKVPLKNNMIAPILSNIDGVYDGNPSDEKSQVITDIELQNDVSDVIQEGKSSFGRGGMATKYRIARKVASEGIAVVIANGKRDNILLDVVAVDRNVPYTLFHPAMQVASGVKKWIAHSEGFAKGELHVNQGATDALLSARGASLLPVGVTAVVGDFEKDDIVKVIAPNGDMIAVGKVGCDSDMARQVVGESGARPLIHSDYMYID